MSSATTASAYLSRQMLRRARSLRDCSRFGQPPSSGQCKFGRTKYMCDCCRSIRAHRIMISWRRIALSRSASYNITRSMTSSRCACPPPVHAKATASSVTPSSAKILWIRYRSLAEGIFVEVICSNCWRISMFLWRFRSEMLALRKKFLNFLEVLKALKTDFWESSTD